MGCRKNKRDKTTSSTSLDNSGQSVSVKVVKRLQVTGALFELKIQLENRGMYTSSEWVKIFIGETPKFGKVPFMLSLTRIESGKVGTLQTARDLKGHAALELFNQSGSVFSVPDTVGCISVRTLQKPSASDIKVVIMGDERYVEPEFNYSMEHLQKLLSVGKQKISEAYEEAFDKVIRCWLVLPCLNRQLQMKGGGEQQAPISPSGWARARKAMKTSTVVLIELELAYCAECCAGA